MKCIICNQRKGKRHCPAKNGLICPRCCGEKRVIEIRCPQECPYLSEGLSYQWTKAYVSILDWIDDPAQRRKFYESTRKHGDVLGVLELEIVNYSKNLRALTDSEVLEAIETVIKTYQTEERGVIYEHSTPNPLAQSLVKELRRVIREEGEESDEGRSSWSRSAVIATLEAMQLHLAYHQEEGTGERSYLDFVRRNHPEASSQGESDIIVSG